MFLLLPYRRSPKQRALAIQKFSEHTLGQHGVGHLDKAGHVGAHHQVALHAAVLGGVVGVVEDVDHDALELLVHFLEGQL